MALYEVTLRKISVASYSGPYLRMQVLRIWCTELAGGGGSSGEGASSTVDDINPALP